MKLQKQADTMVGQSLDSADLERINALSRKKLTPEEVYTFCVRLCDNEVDRDGERFPTQTLQELAQLFVGKSGMFDHQWTAAGQTARIYHTELVQEEGLTTEAGDPYCYLKGYAYMLRTGRNADLIEEIEGGIKKEVSVGCAVRKNVCSICGGELSACGHEKGKRYDGRLCFVNLCEATDAYEWSFVAVPAQRNAGVIKRFDHKSVDLKAALQDRPELASQLKHLEQEAAAGRRYLDALREETARLGQLAGPELDAATRKAIVQKLSEQELIQLKAAYEKRLDLRFPCATQLCYQPEPQAATEKDLEFLI